MKRNAVAKQVKGFSEAKSAGDYYFVFTEGNDQPVGMFHTCPCGCGMLGSLWFRGRRPAGAEWDVAGEWPKATLSPSIGFYGENTLEQGYHWHGYLRAGVFEEC